MPLLDNEVELEELTIDGRTVVSSWFDGSDADPGEPDSASSLDFAISASNEACRASSWEFGCGDRGGRLLVDRAEDRRDGVLLASCEVSKSCTASEDDSVEFEF